MHGIRGEKRSLLVIGMADISLDQQQVAAVRAALEAAENAFDADAATALLAEDAVLMVPDFPVQEGKEACAAFLRETLSWLEAGFERRVEYRSDEISVDGDIAFDRGRFVLTVTSRLQRETTHVGGKYLWLLRRVGPDDWILTRLIASRDQEETEAR